MRFPEHLLRYVLGTILAIHVLGSAVAASPNEDESPFHLREGDRVVFYGDSITEQRLYTNLVETFVFTRFPHLRVSFINSGWAGDRVSGGGGGDIDLRLRRDVITHQPTALTVMLGMNDMEYRSFDESIYRRYVDGYRSMLDIIQQELPKARVTLLMPSPYDDVTRPPFGPEGYNYVLKRFGSAVRKMGLARNMCVADLNGPVVSMLERAFTLDHELSKKLIDDRVHPGQGAQLIMAASLLKAWNAPATVTEVIIDASSGAVEAQKHTTVSSLKVGKGLSWHQKDQRLPFPIDWSDAALLLALQASDFMETMNQQMLCVKRLSGENYTLSIDGREIANFSTSDLSKGVNLAALQTPMQAQAARVSKLTKDHNDVHFWTWRQIQIRLPIELGDHERTVAPISEIIDALTNKELTIVEQQRIASMPVSHFFELNPTQTSPNIALGKRHSDSHPNAMSEWFAGLTDGVKSGREGHVWASDDSAQFPKTTTIDLGDSVEVTAVKVSVPEYGSTNTVEVLVSESGEKFTRVGEHKFEQKSASTWGCDFPAKKARFVRLNFPDHHQGQVEYSPTYIFITEVEVFGPSDD